MTQEHPIDFVLPWVDGNDPAWLQEFKQYYRGEKGVDASPSRFRNWDNLQYWFRGIETFAPWVRTVHFVTCGHLPKWLNTAHPQLHIVNTRDFIPKEYMPTFSSFPITLNMHRIEGLAEHFVYSNDDMFLGRPIPRTRFFRNGLPVDMAQLTVVPPINPFVHYTVNILEIVHRRHKVWRNILRHPYKWINPRYGIGAVCKTLSLLPWNSVASIRNPHQAIPLLRSVFEQMWQEEFAAFDTASRSKFRVHSDITDWLIRCEQLLSGKFVPHGIGDTRADTLSDANVESIARYITDQRYAMFCINETTLLLILSG
jgi:hypothetical protein